MTATDTEIFAAMPPRFRSKVDTENGPLLGKMDTHCWVWAGARDLKGYGRFRFMGTVHGAARVINGVCCGMNSHLDALHHCDNPGCVRPSHLFLGTDADNVADMIAKGRNSPTKGDQNGNSVLGSEGALELRFARALGATFVTLGRRFGVHKHNARHVALGLGWKDVPLLEEPEEEWGVSKRGARGERNSGSVLTEDQVLELRFASRLGAANGQLAERFRISKSAAQFAVTCRSWKHLPPCGGTL